MFNPLCHLNQGIGSMLSGKEGTLYVSGPTSQMLLEQADVMAYLVFFYTNFSRCFTYYLTLSDQVFSLVLQSLQIETQSIPVAPEQPL